MILLFSLFIIVLFHEIGHFLTARLFKCKVTEFAIGFGPTIFQKKIGLTIYKVNLLLLGGYVKLKDELVYSRSKYSFTNLRYTQKVIISLSGIGVNCWSALLAYWLYIMTFNITFLLFGLYSLMIGVLNLLPIPSLDGSYPIAFLFEKKYGKKKCYQKMESLFTNWLQWILFLNILTLPYLFWLIYKGKIL